MPSLAGDDVPARLVSAATEVIVSRGGASMPLRDVARRAGVTTGAIQHHFGGKRGLLLAVLRRQGMRIVDRLRALRTDDPPRPPGVAMVVLLELLPLDDERRVEAQTAVTFETIAMHDEELRLAYRTQHEQLAALLSAQLPDSSREGVELILAAIGGMRTDLLLGRVPPQRAPELVERLLDELAR